MFCIYVLSFDSYENYIWCIGRLFSYRGLQRSLNLISSHHIKISFLFFYSLEIGQAIVQSWESCFVFWYFFVFYLERKQKFTIVDKSRYNTFFIRFLRLHCLIRQKFLKFVLVKQNQNMTIITITCSRFLLCFFFPFFLGGGMFKFLGGNCIVYGVKYWVMVSFSDHSPSICHLTQE